MTVSQFDSRKIKDECVKWIKDWFIKNGNNCNAVIGISGGKDSSVVAALCVEALGKDRVIGVLMPNGTQSDIQDAYKLVEHLNIKYCEVNIHDATKALLDNINIMYSSEHEYDNITISEQTKINLPSRVRMATLYAVSQSCNGRVANTCNLSEDYVGYSTRYGDSAGDFSPLANLTVSEVKAIGHELNLPTELIEKTPSDGLCGRTDEDNLGFSYDVLDKYIRTAKCEDLEVDELHRRNIFKLQPMQSFSYVAIGESNE